ncbi:glutamate 5-kinase [Clostridia bacterium]|nr:glutamate 5-kinase [Clostridia bacterium]
MDISEKKRIVIKVGTSTIAHKTGNLNIRTMRRITRILSDIKNSGKEIVLVSSGAVGLGIGLLGLKERPTDIPTKQALASVGQCELMSIYDDMFGKYSVIVSQVLLTRNIEELKHVENAFNKLLEFGVVPIVNENDTVAIDELIPSYGENDTLAAIVAEIIKADLLVIMSDVDGIYDSDPHINPDAKIIQFVQNIDEHIEKIAGGASTSLGSGGMATKINAAKIAMKANIPMLIMNGDNPENLYDLFDGKLIGTDKCTLFYNKPIL